MGRIPALFWRVEICARWKRAKQQVEQMAGLAWIAMLGLILVGTAALAGDAAENGSAHEDQFQHGHPGESGHLLDLLLARFHLAHIS